MPHIDLNPVSVLKRHGVLRKCNLLAGFLEAKLRNRYFLIKHRNAEVFKNPNPADYAQIEFRLQTLGINVENFCVDNDDFERFKAEFPFPPDYHGGIRSGLWQEKIFEHFIAYRILSLHEFDESDIYVDVAAGSSPWAKMLRDRWKCAAFALDLTTAPDFLKYDYYLTQNATATPFSDGSVKGVSLQCAYEMFTGTDDIVLLVELQRILQNGGKAVIVPIYLHTHYCCYATPEYYAKGYGDPEAKEYIRWDCGGVPSSRKYDAEKFKERIVSRILALGMSYKLYVLRNAREISPEIYCHFILEISK